MQNYKITPRQIENATVEVEALLGLAKNKEHFSTVIANDFVADEAKKESEHWYQKVAEVEGAISAARRGEVPYLQAKTIFEVAAGVTSLLDWEYKDNSPLPELEVGAYSALTDTQLMQYFLQMCKHKNDIDDESYTAMKDRKLVLKGDTLASLREKLEYYKANPKFEDVKMKKYALVIDTSGANKGGSQILVQDFDTLLQARAKLATLNLSFGYGEGKVYCATIAERAEGTLNRYFQIQRTDDGKKWNEDVSERPYIPVDWEKIENWLDIEKFRTATKSVNWKEQIGESFSLNGNPDGLKYTVVSVNDDDSVNIVREDSWTFRAVRPETLGNGKIEWAYSTDGYFASEEILSQYISAKNTEKSSESEDFVMQNDSIKARVTPIENGTNLKGSATVTIGDQFAIHGVKIVEGKDGLFVSMPSEKDKNGEFQSTVFPTSRESAQHLKSIVLGAYQDALQNGKQEKNELSPMQMNVKVSNLRENTYGNNVKASCQITVNGAFVVKGVKVVEKSDGTLFAAMPSKQDQYGEYIAVANPITKEFNEKVQQAVIYKYNNRDNEQEAIIGNTAFKELGENPQFKTLNSKFAEKVGAELDALGTKWSGKVDGERTLIAVSSDDGDKLESAVETAKIKSKAVEQSASEISPQASEKLQNAIARTLEMQNSQGMTENMENMENMETPTPRKGGRK